jgi:predicted metal-dependent phosphoesterase TrpH
MMSMFRVEFHCHTNASGDSLTRPADLVRIARRKGLDRLIITDHNTIAGAQAAQALDPELVIVGEEILTTRGELLCAFVTTEIPAYLTPLETIKRLRDQGAFISVSHPFDRVRKGAWQEADLLEIAPLVDAIEVFNSRCLSPAYNAAAQAFAEQHNIPGTVGSDAHGLVEVGRSFLELEPFAGAEQLRQVIRWGRPRVKASPWWVHLISRYASVKKGARSA